MTEQLNHRVTDDQLVDAVSRMGPVPELSAPPDDLWRSIASAVAEVEAEAEAVEPSAPQQATAPSNVVSLRRGWKRPVAASAAAVVALAAVGGLALRGGDDPTAEFVAETDLEPLTAEVKAAHSTLERIGDQLVLEIDAELVATGSDFHELWLLDVEATEPISLGRYEGPGTYVVPDGVAPAQFPVVDISIEPDDGDDSHSGSSVLRGALDL